MVGIASWRIAGTVCQGMRVQHEGVEKESGNKRSESNGILNIKLSQIFPIRLIILRHVFHGPTPMQKRTCQNKKTVIIIIGRIRSIFLIKI